MQHGQRRRSACLMMKGSRMAINPPVDATGTAAWKKLQQHYDELQAQGIDLKQWF